MSAARKLEPDTAGTDEPQAPSGKVVPMNKADKDLPLAPIGRDAHVGDRYMPVYIQEEETSPVWMSGKAVAIVAAGRLWRRSWQSRPVGSLPDNDEWIRKNAGIADRRSWESLRALVMHGYQRMLDPNDGTVRWYHLKQIAWAKPFLDRREQRNGSRGKSDDVEALLKAVLEAANGGGDAAAVLREAIAKAAREKPKARAEVGALPERHSRAPNSLHSVTAENNGLDENAAPIKEKKRKKKEETLPSEGTAGAVDGEPKQGSLLPGEPEPVPPEPEVEPIQKLRDALKVEWSEIMTAIAPALPAKDSAIVAGKLASVFGGGIKGPERAVAELRALKTRITAGQIHGYSVAKDDKTRAAQVKSYLWGIANGEQQPETAAPGRPQQQRPKTRTDEARDAYQRARAARTGEAAPDDDDCVVIDGQAEEHMA